MSSNVGLTTPRGSGTSGYVQRNLSALKPRAHHTTGQPYPSRDLPGPKVRQPDKAILAHEKERAIEVKVLELRDKLEDEGLDEEEIETRCEELRKELAEKGGDTGGGKGKLKSYQVHELAAEKEKEQERLRRALGINKDYVEGSYWERREKEKEKEKEKRERDVELEERWQKDLKMEREREWGRRRGVER
jgi:hypothetical protein